MEAMTHEALNTLIKLDVFTLIRSNKTQWIVEDNATGELLVFNK